MSTTITVQDLLYRQSLDRVRSGPHPARVILFTDQGSFWHVVMGLLTGAVSSPWNLGTAAMFSGYELSKLASGESIERTGGKFIEFGLGLLLAGLIRLVVS